MTRNEKIKITERINTFADSVLKDVDRKNTPISMQLESLKPVMEEIAGEYGKTVSDIFILYMDTNTELSAENPENLDEEGIQILYE